MRTFTGPSRRTPVGLRAALCLLACSACSGAAAEQRTAAPTAQMASPEEEGHQQDRVDEIMRLCNRKAGTAVPRCWNDEYMRTHKKFEAQVTLMIVTTPTGTAEEVKVVSASASSKELQDCLIGEARSWSYPEGKSQTTVNCSFFLRSSM